MPQIRVSQEALDSADSFSQIQPGPMPIACQPLTDADRAVLSFLADQMQAQSKLLRSLLGTGPSMVKLNFGAAPTAPPESRSVG